jgi:signal transduction histidine kinase
VILYDDKNAEQEVVATYAPDGRFQNYQGFKFKLDQEDYRRMVDPSQSVFAFSKIQSVRDFPLSDFFVAENINAMAAARLHHQEQFLGTLAIFTSDERREFTEEELNFLRGLADHASLAITNIRLFEGLRDSRFRLQVISRHLVDVQESERRSMARELHDQVGQMLTGLQFSLERGKRKSSDEALSAFEDAQAIVKDLIKQVRNLSLSLLPSMLEDMGLLPTLNWYFEQYANQMGIQIDFSEDGLEEQRLPKNTEITAYRIIQEGLTNIARHAQVREAIVDLKLEGFILHILISDRGKGFDPDKTISGQRTFGLLGMRERVTLNGGKFKINAAPGKGTQLITQLPLGDYLERRDRAR